MVNINEEILNPMFKHKYMTLKILSYNEPLRLLKLLNFKEHLHREVIIERL